MQQERDDASRRPRSRSAEITRKYAVRAVLTGAVAAAAWYLGVRPLEHALAAQRAEFDQQMAELTADASNEASLSQSRARVASLRERVLSLAAWTERAGARSNAYDAFRQIAANASVRIVRIEPKGQFVLSPRRDSKEPVGEVFGHGVHVTGGFREVAAFLDKLETELGSSRVLGFRLAPLRGPGSVEASIDTSHIALKTGSLRTLAAQAAAPDAGAMDTSATGVGR